MLAMMKSMAIYPLTSIGSDFVLSLINLETLYRGCRLNLMMMMIIIIIIGHARSC